MPLRFRRLLFLPLLLGTAGHGEVACSFTRIMLWETTLHKREGAKMLCLDKKTVFLTYAVFMQAHMSLATALSRGINALDEMSDYYATDQRLYHVWGLLQHLEGLSANQRQQGQGSFLARADIKQRLSGLRGFFRQLRNLLLSRTGRYHLATDEILFIQVCLVELIHLVAHSSGSIVSKEQALKLYELRQNCVYSQVLAEDSCKLLMQFRLKPSVEYYGLAQKFANERHSIPDFLRMFAE